MTAAIACGQALDDRQDQVVQVDCEQWKNSKLLAGSSLHFLVAVFGLVGVCALASYHHPNRPDQPDEALSVRHTKPFDQPGAGEPWWQCVIDVLGKFEADGGP